MKHEWSTKYLIREIMLSRVYMQSSENPFSWQRDPDNKLLARMNRKRLEWEPMRDSLLAVSGELDLKMSGPSLDIFGKTRRRSLYAFIDRQNLPTTFRTFDAAIPDTHSPMRFTTTVPQQTLYFMNSSLVIELADRFLKRADIQQATEPAERIHRCYRLCLSRNASPSEVSLALRYLGNKPEATHWQRFIQAIFMTNEFLYVD